jgi:hypothetical protein
MLSLVHEARRGGKSYKTTKLRARIALSLPATPCFKADHVAVGRGQRHADHGHAGWCQTLKWLATIQRNKRSAQRGIVRLWGIAEQVGALRKRKFLTDGNEMTTKPLISSISPLFVSIVDTTRPKI